MMVSAPARLVSAPRRLALKQPHVRALAMLHENYTWSGVRAWLGASDVRIPGAPPMRTSGRALFLCHPSTVADYYDAVASGVMG